MNVSRLAMIILVAAMSALLGAACGGSDQVGEKLAEKIIEDSAENGDVDVDIDGDEVTIDSKDGSGSFSTSGDLPKDWPSELAFPDGATITMSATDNSGSGPGQTVTATVKDDPADVMKHFGDALDGWKQTANSNVDNGGESLANGAWTKDDTEVTVTAMTSTEGTMVTVTHHVKG